MTGFSAHWLRQREPFDLAARHPTLAADFRTALTQQARSAQGRASSLRIMDLACGSGANFRALAPLLKANQTWLMIDHDPLLLSAQRTEIAQWAQQHGWQCQAAEDTLTIDTGSARWLVRGQQLNLARQLEDIDLAACDGLVTTAFLDLVSADWLDRLTTLMTRTRRPLLATLTVDGRRTWHPARPDDHLVADAFVSHQGGDKGFGPSLGVKACAYLAARLAAHSYRVETQASDWHIGPAQRDMLLTMTTEAAEVARETTLVSPSTLSNWLAERTHDIHQGLLSLQVGHLDLLAVPSRP